MILLGPFSLDEDTGRIRYGEVERTLRPKSLAVLRELVRRSGRLVTKAELFQAGWAGTTVSETVLRVCIREIRALLAEGDGSVAIESVARRGYRLLEHGARPALGADGMNAHVVRNVDPAGTHCDHINGVHSPGQLANPVSGEPKDRVVHVGRQVKQQ